MTPDLFPVDRPATASRLLWLLNRTSRRQRQFMRLAIDLGLMTASVWIAFATRLGTFVPPVESGYLWLLPMILATRIPAFAWLGLYRSDMMKPGMQVPGQIMTGIAISLVGIGLPIIFVHPVGFPRSVVIIEAGLSAAMIIAAREIIRRMLTSRHRRLRRREPVLIYGAGNAGLQLAGSLNRDLNHEYQPIGFLDDDPVKQGSQIDGLNVYRSEEMSSIAKREGVERVLFAVPSLPAWQREPVLKKIYEAGLEVQTVPSMIDLINGRLDLRELGEVSSGDLLGREAVPPDPKLMGADVASKSVLVTGAGGSIGSELCRRIAAVGPRTLVLFELNEYALYRIEMELATRFPKLRIAAVLGSVLNRTRIESTIRRFGVETVYHAAAHKHVPIVEQNPLEGLFNNVIGTWRAAEAAVEGGVGTFVLISTDKAVRPASVMGASKRAAEFACVLGGARARERALRLGRPLPRFTTVRFGNVLDSTGSVVPLFRSQIERGGPVTVTHPEMVRYFMTITEASELVLQAGALARGGEVFLLDMGAPIRIDDIARRMIGLGVDRTGHRVEIRYSGLRPGEKLVEELLADPARSESTPHAKIRRAQEDSPEPDAIEQQLLELEGALGLENQVRCLEVLQGLVRDYTPAGALADIAWSGETGFSFELPRRQAPTSSPTHAPTASSVARRQTDPDGEVAAAQA